MDFLFLGHQQAILDLVGQFIIPGTFALVSNIWKLEPQKPHFCMILTQSD